MPDDTVGMVLEGPAQSGSRYQFETSTDLLGYTPIDVEFTATSPFVTTFIEPERPQRFYRLKRLQ